MNLTDKPILCSDAVREVIDGQSLVATADGELLHFGTKDDPEGVNPVSELAISMADGHHTLGEIIETIVREFDIDSPQATEDLTAFFDDLIKRGAYRVMGTEEHFDL